MLGMNVLFGLVQMTMSPLFRLDIPFLLQLQPFRCSVLKSLHHFMNRLLPYYLGTKKISQYNIQNWKRTRQQAGRSSKYYTVTETYFYLISQRGKWHALKVSWDFKEPFMFYIFQISCTPLVSRILNTHKYQSWRAQCWSLKLNRCEDHGTFKLLFAFPNRRNQCNIIKPGVPVPTLSLASHYRKYSVIFMYLNLK